MTAEEFTSVIAERVLGWKVTPDRFIKSGRSWIPRWRFTPLTRLDHAFELLDRAASEYRVMTIAGVFSAEVQVGNRTGKATGEPKAKTITLAIARALGIEAPQ